MPLYYLFTATQKRRYQLHIAITNRVQVLQSCDSSWRWRFIIKFQHLLPARRYASSSISRHRVSVRLFVWYKPAQYQNG